MESKLPEDREDRLLQGKVIKNYITPFAHPFVLHEGDQLSLHDRESEWSGWVWCTNPADQSGWAPENLISRFEDRGTALRDYDATELNVKVGEELVVLNEESRWYWCRNSQSKSGWVPCENVELLEPRK